MVPNTAKNKKKICASMTLLMSTKSSGEIVRFLSCMTSNCDKYFYEWCDMYGSWSHTQHLLLLPVLYVDKHKYVFIFNPIISQPWNTLHIWYFNNISSPCHPPLDVYLFDCFFFYISCRETLICLHKNYDNMLNVMIFW